MGIVSTILVWIGGWLAEEMVTGIFKAATGTTPSDITASAITKAVNYARSLYNPSPQKVNAYYDKKGDFIGRSGSGFGGSGGGVWSRISTLS